MKILERYILKENFKPFIVSLLVTTFIMIFDRLLDILDLIILKKPDFLTVVSIFGLSLPFMLALTIPMAVLLASIMSFGRLATDNELIAFKSCGINIYTLIKPTVIAALLLSIFMVYFNNKILPDSNHKLKILTQKVAQRKPMTSIKPKTFLTLKDFTLYAEEKKDNNLYGILIYDFSNSRFPMIISAKSGNVDLSNGGNTFKATFYNGEIHKPDRIDYNKYQTTKYKKMTFYIPDLGNKYTTHISNYRGDRELSSKAMIKINKERREDIAHVQKEITSLQKELRMVSISEMKKDLKKNKIRILKNKLEIKEDRVNSLKRQIRQYEVEIHKKYAIAFACLIFVLIGVPIGMMTRTSGVGMAFSVSSVIFMIYYTFLTVGEDLADKGIISPFISMWIANIIFGIIGIFLVIYSVKETKFIDIYGALKKVSNLFLKIGGKIFIR